MEKFYITGEGSKLRKDYLRYKDSTEELRKIINEFFKTHGIQSEKFQAGQDYLGITATKEDIEMFKAQLKIQNENGLNFFKKNSSIYKSWLLLVKQMDLKIIHKPYLFDYFKPWYGRSSYRLFDIEGVVYCSFKTDGDFEPVDNLREIKASEFFKIIEDYNESLKA